MLFEIFAGDLDIAREDFSYLLVSYGRTTMRKTVDLLGVGRQKDRRPRPDAYRRRIRRLCEPVSLPPRLARRTDTTTATISGLGVTLSNHGRSLPLLFKCKLLSAGQQWYWPA